MEKEFHKQSDLKMERIDSRDFEIKSTGHSAYNDSLCNFSMDK